jgi:hypothetical protein
MSIRSYVSDSGSFVAVPSAFAAADEGLRNVIKLQFKTILSGERSDRFGLETVFSTDRVLVDLAAVIPAVIDPKKIIRDCELVKQIASTNAGQLNRLVEVFHGDHPDIDEAYRIATQVGLTEEASVKAGGGLLGLVVLLIVAAVAAGCAHVKPTVKPDPK